MRATKKATSYLLVPAVVMTIGIGTALACMTPDRAAVLGKNHPDPGFVTRIAHAHAPNPIEYRMDQPMACKNGTADGFPCQGIDLVGHIPLNEIGGGTGSDSWGWTDPETGKEWAIIGRSNGVAFVDVSDPADIVYTANLPRPSDVGNNVWADIKVYNNHAFMVADAVSNYGMQVFDLTRLRDIDNPPVTLSADAEYDQFNSAHNIAINTDTGFAYIVGGDTCSSGPHMVNISDPLNPQFAGCFADDGYTHDIQCLVYRGPDSEHRGREICFASNEDTLTIIDVTDKSKPVQLSRTPYEQTGYTHQGWLTEDQAYFLMDDELDEVNQPDIETTRTLTMDVRDLDQPTLAGEYLADGASIDHNQYVLGSYTYQANYRRGLRVLKLDDPSTGSMTEVAYFDTYPEGDGNNFDGAWNVYPFFPSGNLLISDFNRGFFLVRPKHGSVDVIARAGFE